MNDIELLLNEVKDKLYSNETVKEYFRLKQIIETDEEIKKLDEEVRFHQRKMCEFQKDDSKYFAEKTLYEKAKNKLENNPIYINFEQIKSEINALLIDIRDFLS